MLKVLPRGDVSAGPVVREAALAQGWLVSPPEKLGEREQTRQADLARLVRLSEQFDGGVGAFVASLHERFGATAGRGVHLLTLHRAKGLEFEAVHIPRLEEGELPNRRADLDDERRLLYVGLTRAKRHLLVTWDGKPSRFLKELGVQAGSAAPRKVVAEDAPPGFDALREWRLERAKADEVPAYVVFHNATLVEIAERKPRTLAELASVPGVGPAKLERYGEDLLAALARVA
jgi:DNA helicase II / ATP-dependent DNA helicase PcrA